MTLKEIKEKKILILGFGKEGKDTFLFLRKIFPKKTLGIADKNSEVKDKNLKNVKWYLGENYLDSIKNYEVIIKSPGIPIHLPEIEKAFKEGKITSQTEIFLKHCPGKIVGITATKGKSTTASLIYEVLKKGNLKTHLVGNIGQPVLNFLFSAKKDDIFVYELSCHQLFNLKKSPQIAVFLNFYPEHLDYYKDLKEYLMAKANITLWQKKEDFLIYNPKNKYVKKVAKLSNAKKIPLFCPESILKSYNIKKIPFLASFYSLNIAAAIKVGEIFKIEKEKIKEAIENFKPLPHRLEYVGNFKGVDFFNDSLSTIPETTILAMKTFGNKLGTLILGGFDRGVDFKDLAKEILKRKIPTLILFPESGERIWKEILKIEKKNLPKTFLVQNMRDAVKIAFNFTKEGKICLLSPASPSFGLFKNYKERGNLFKKYIRLYGKK